LRGGRPLAAALRFAALALLFSYAAFRLASGFVLGVGRDPATSLRAIGLGLLGVAGLAAVAVWRLGRARIAEPRLDAWLRLLLRLALALALIPEGLSRLIPVQAPPPQPSILLQRLGELATFDLLEVFLGFSPAYQAFTGVAALLGGLLLLGGRTTLLGTVLSTAALGMLALQNLCYDGPARLASIHLLAMSLLLIAPDLRRLVDALVLNRPVEAAALPPLFADAARQRATRILVALLGLLAVGVGLAESAARYRQLHPPRPPFYGAWAVESLRVDGVEVAPFAEPSAWGWMVFEQPGVVLIERRIGSRRQHALVVDESAKTLTLGLANGGTREPGDVLSYSEPGPHRLVLDGRVEGRLVHAELGRMTLISTAYHWPWGPEYEE
jgi:hypothetical protein